MRHDSDKGRHVRRIGRYILNGLTVLSLLLSVATVALFVRSYHQTDRMLWWQSRPAQGTHYNDDLYRLVAERGRLGFVHDGGTCLWWYPYDFIRWRVSSSPAPPPAQRPAEAPEPLDWPFRGQTSIYAANVAAKAGFEHGTYQLVEPYNSLIVTEDVWGAPLLAVVCVFAILPAVRWRRMLPRHRRRPGVCVRCGYDLRATPARCPECGTVSTKAKA
jgi:hypothetical protein